MSLCMLWQYLTELVVFVFFTDALFTRQFSVKNFKMFKYQIPKLGLMERKHMFLGRNIYNSNISTNYDKKKKKKKDRESIRN